MTDKELGDEMNGKTERRIETLRKTRDAYHLKFLQEKARAETLSDEVEHWKERYFDLVYQVSNKYPGESRHDTAKRCIKADQDSASPANVPALAARQAGDRA